jgi:dTDP-glucose pyrophosphorylase/CBS domain-containing protein
MMDLKNKITINLNEPLRKAMQVLNDLAIERLALLVTDENNCVIGTATDGDIRRALLNGSGIQTPVSEIANRNFKFLRQGEKENGRLAEWRKQTIHFIPVLDKDHRLVSVIDLDEVHALLPVQALLMAGGKGERLMPLTKSTPKPLLPVGDKPIINRNLERLKSYGVSHFDISVCYLAEKIEGHFGNGNQLGVNIGYIREDEPMGTIGALRKVKDEGTDAVLVMNSDLLTNIDFEDFFRHFTASGADMAVATIPYHVDVPYAVLETDKHERIVSFSEKPRYTYYSNAGIYLLKWDAVKFIPASGRFDATDLMETLIKNGRSVSAYAIVGYWLDIGRMDDYNKAQEDVKHIQF